LCQIIIYVRNREANAVQSLLRRRILNYKSRIAENQNKEIVVIDEIDKMSIKDQEGLLTMMELGNFTSTKVRNTKTENANTVIFATSNSTEPLSKPLLSRFSVFEIPEYSYEEFEAIIKLPQNTVIQLASSMWKLGSRDIRDVLKIAKLCNPSIQKKI
jgi:MoxR-like ATPase